MQEKGEPLCALDTGTLNSFSILRCSFRRSNLRKLRANFLPLIAMDSPTPANRLANFAQIRSGVLGDGMLIADDKCAVADPGPRSSRIHIFTGLKYGLIRQRGNAGKHKERHARSMIRMNYWTSKVEIN